MAARAATWREADAKRAVAAAQKAGLRAYRVDIAPDGTISIVVGTAANQPARKNSWDDVIKQ